MTGKKVLPNKQPRCLNKKTHPQGMCLYIQNDCTRKPPSEATCSNVTAGLLARKSSYFLAFPMSRISGRESSYFLTVAGAAEDFHLIPF